MSAWLRDLGPRDQLFIDAPANAGVWIGSLQAIGAGRELCPVRFAGVDFLFLFLSPHVEAGGDDDFLRQTLETADVKDFYPSEQSRLIKFCRADAEEGAFKPDDWHLPEAFQIFQFMEVIADVMRLYLDSMTDVEQFIYLPASESLGRIYNRVFKRLSKGLGDSITAILPPTGACHAYQRTY